MCKRCGDAACAACVKQNARSQHCQACHKWAIERRVALLGAERVVRALGVAIVCLTVGLLVCFVGMLIAVPVPKLRGVLVLTWFPVAATLVFFAIYGLALARARTSWRWPAVAAGVGMLPLVPLGSLLGIASLLALHSRRVRELLSKDHLSIIASTPEVSLGRSFAVLAVSAAVLWPVASIVGFVVIYTLMNDAPG